MEKKSCKTPMMNTADEQFHQTAAARGQESREGMKCVRKAISGGKMPRMFKYRL
jgi:hypothetical protein